MITIYGIREKLNPIKQGLSELMFKVIDDVIGTHAIPGAHRYILLERADFIYPTGCSDAYTVIEISIAINHSIDKKKRLITSLIKSISEQLSIPADDIEITLLEQAAHCRGYNGVTGDEARIVHLQGLSA